MGVGVTELYNYEYYSPLQFELISSFTHWSARGIRSTKWKIADRYRPKLILNILLLDNSLQSDIRLLDNSLQSLYFSRLSYLNT